MAQRLVSTPQPRCKKFWTHQSGSDGEYLPPSDRKANTRVSAGWYMPHPLTTCESCVAKVAVQIHLNYEVIETPQMWDPHIMDSFIRKILALSLPTNFVVRSRKERTSTARRKT